MNPRHALPRQPWWRTSFMYLVLGLPLIAVVGSLSLVVVAVNNADEIIKPTAQQAPERPALEGRNHAATGGKK